MGKIYKAKTTATFLVPGILLLIVLFLSAFKANAQFTTGRLVVLQVGDGSTALTNAATPVFLKEYSTAGVAGFSVTLPASGSSALTISGSATSEGLITRSSDGFSIIIPGYNANSGTAAIAGTTSAVAPRTIGKVTAAGVFTLPVTTTSFSANNPRGATSDGSNFWGSGANSGIVLETSGAGTVVSSTSTNNRALGIYNGNLYFSTGSGTRGIYQVGSGLPTTAGNPSTFLFSTSTTASSPYQFAFSPAGIVAYVADDATGIYKWTFNGTAWSSVLVNATTCRGLVVDFSDANPIIYATTAATTNSIIKITDVGAGYPIASTTIATASSNAAFRGIAFTPEAVVTSPTINLSVSSTTGSEANATVITVTATASSAVTGDQTVSLAVSGTNITAGDYILSTSTIIVSGGSTTGSTTFTVTDDADVEGTETALLTISNPSAGIILGTTTTQNIAITDNDASINLCNYVRIGRYDLPEPTRTTAPPNSLLAQEVSGVTYNWDTETLFVVGDGGTSVVQVSKTGQLINSMTLAPGGSPQNTDFYDPEGITYVGNGKFVMIEERDRQAVLFTYAPGTTLTRANTQTVKLGTFVQNIGIEGLSYDPLTGGFICVKETQPQGIFQTGIDFNAGTATNGSATTENSINLFDPALANLLDFADVFALSNIPALNGQPNYGNLIVLSQESGKIINIDRSGNISSSLTIINDPGNPLTVPAQQHEGLTMDRDGILYVVSENGGGDFDHPQLWVYAPSSVPNQAPTAITLNNSVTTLAENTSTTSRLKVADIDVTDDGLRCNNIVTLSGADANFFEMIGAELFIKAGTVLDFETKSSYSISVNVDDPTVGGSPDATATYTLTLTDVLIETPPGVTLIVSEVAPWSSGNSPVGADWFELTNTGTNPVTITGWKVDDNSNSSTAAVALNGITTIAAGETVIFLETATPATTIPLFLSTWFGNNPPAGLQVGSYTGGGVGLSTGGDAINVFNGNGELQAKVTFGTSPAGPSFPTFNNAIGLNNTTISILSVVGVNDAFAAINDPSEIGSPGTIGKLYITEVAPWSSGNSPVGADWFEVTNTRATAVDITGWKIDDNSGSPAAAIALNGITSIAPGESVIFLETGTPATTIPLFLSTWFGANPPSGLQVGSYSGSGVGLGTGGDAVNLYNNVGVGVLQASVLFGNSPTGTFRTFDNAAKLNNITISQLSAVGVNGAFIAANDVNEIGSPGAIVNGPCPTITVTATQGAAILCNGGTTTVTVSASGGTAPYTGTGVFTKGAGTNIIYSVTDAHGCTGSTVINITEPAQLIATESHTAILCFGGSSPVTISATGGTAPYTGTGTFTQSAGTQSYTVTDANGCTSSVSVTVTQPTQLVAAESHTDILCFGGSSTVTISATGGTAPYTGTGTFTQSAGTQSYTVTDANGCTSSVSVTVTQSTQLVASENHTSILCFGRSSTVTITATGGTAPYTGTGTFTQSAGTQSYTVTDANGCTSTISVTVTQPTQFTASATSTPASGGSNGTATANPSGGTPPYTYSWNTLPVQTTQTAAGLAAGTYTVTVTDAGGCTITTTTTVTSACGVIANAGPDKTVCPGGTVTLTASATGGTTSTPPPPQPFTEVAGSTADMRIFSGSIDYIAIGNTFSQSEDMTNCGKNATASKTLTLPPGAVIKKAYLYWSGSGSLDNTVKLNGATITADGTRTYNRSGGFYYFGARKDVTGMVTGAGTYTVSNLSWSNGSPYCNDNSAYGGWAMTVVYELSSLPNARIHINTEKFQFTYPAATYFTTINNLNVPAGCNANAKLTIIGFEGDNYKTEKLRIAGTLDPDLNNFRGQSGPNLDIITKNAPSIAGGTASLTYSIESYLQNTDFGPSVEGVFDYVKILKYNNCPQGGCNGYKYEWKKGFIVVGTTQSINVSTAGTYTVKVTDCTNCSATDDVVVTASTLAVTATAGAPINCYGGTTTITIAATGGAAPYTGTGIFTKGAGTWNFTVTDAAGCTKATLVTITQPSPLTATAIAPQIPCGGTTTTVTVSASGGTTPYTGTGTFTKPAGTYTFIVTDAKGCTKSVSVTVTTASCGPVDPNKCYKLIARHSGKAATVVNSSTSNGGNVEQRSYNGGNNQIWKFELVQTGYYKIINVNSGKVLDVAGASNANGANIQQWSYNGGDNQKWSLTANGSYFVVKAKHSGKAMSVENSSNANGADVEQRGNGDDYNEQWSIVEVTCPGYNTKTSGPIVSNDETIEPYLALTVQPNPGTDVFNLITKSNDNINPVNVRILDVNGKVMSVHKTGANSTLRIEAGKWTSGMYFAEVIQGDQRKIVKMVKVN